MAFTSFHYLLFFIITVVINYIIPPKIRYIWLLIASYYFYSGAGVNFVIILLLITGISYFSGLCVEKSRVSDTDGKAGQKRIMAVAIIILFGMLIFYKYSQVFIKNVNFVLQDLLGMQSFKFDKVVMPLGLSFIIFQATSYVIDVYRGNIKAERNFLKVAFYLAFFPKLISGPIEKAKEIIGQADDKPLFQLEQVKQGLSFILLGLFYKTLISDNIALIVDPVLDSYADYSGVEICLAIILYAFQLYGDFAGYSYMALGSARVLGYKLSDNFCAPFYSESISGFWRRWHITLNKWFRDYLYIPLGGNRKGKVRQYINIMIVFLVSGVWHGNTWNFVIWGGLNGLYVVVESVFGVRGNSLWKKIRTFLLFDFSLLFFRISDLPTVINIIIHAGKEPGIRQLFSLQYLQIFQGVENYAIVIALIFLMFIFEYFLYYNEKNFGELLFALKPLSRWLICGAMLMAIVVWGAYGENYAQIQFIYFQF